MFVDINTYVGHWPFRNLKYNTLNGLDELAQRNGITHMVVANLHGLFYKDCNVANLELLEERQNQVFAHGHGQSHLHLLGKGCQSYDRSRLYGF